MRKIMGLIAVFCTSAVIASTVAIIDSGVDVKHEGLTGNIWINPLEIPDNDRDEDKNGFQDDVYGWNFPGQNNQVINYKYLGTFSDDVYKYFAIQAKQFRGTITRGDIDRMTIDPLITTRKGIRLYLKKTCAIIDQEHIGAENSVSWT